MSQQYGSNRRVNQSPMRRTSSQVSRSSDGTTRSGASSSSFDGGQAMRQGSQGYAQQRASQQGYAQQRPAGQQRSAGQQYSRTQYDSYARSRYGSEGTAQRRAGQGARRTVSDQYARPIGAGEGGFTAAVRGAGGYGGKRRRAFSPGAVIALLVIVAAAVGAFLWFTRFAPITISLNGIETEVARGASVERVIADENVTTVPGRLLAIDGSVIDERGGAAYTALLNGEQVEGGATVAEGDELDITSGADVTEDYTETTEPIPAQFYDSETWGPVQEVVGGQIDGTRATRTGNVSGITVEGLVTQEPEHAYLVRYSVQTDEKVVALTFDDGPWSEWTSEILDILADNGAKATFFIVGDRLQETDGGVELVQREFAEGHQLCSHSYDHASGSGNGVNLSYMAPDEQEWEISQGQQVISDAIGTPCSSAIRAPGGNFTYEVALNVRNYTKMNVNWNVDTEDWQRPGSAAIEAAILSADPGNIILMHDGGGDRSETVEALRSALPQLRDRGYRFVTLDELLSLDQGGRAEALEEAKEQNGESADGE